MVTVARDDFLVRHPQCARNADIERPRRFVLARLEHEKLSPAPEADRAPGQNENDPNGPNDQNVNLNPSCIMRGW